MKNVIYEYDVSVGKLGVDEGFKTRDIAREIKSQYKEEGFTDVKIIQRKYILQEERVVR